MATTASRIPSPDRFSQISIVSRPSLNCAQTGPAFLPPRNFCFQSSGTSQVRIVSKLFGVNCTYFWGASNLAACPDRRRITPPPTSPINPIDPAIMRALFLEIDFDLFGFRSILAAALGLGLALCFGLTANGFDGVVRVTAGSATVLGAPFRNATGGLATADSVAVALRPSETVEAD